MSVDLAIDSLVIPFAASLDLVQTYEEIGGSSLMRMMSGAAVRQTHWRKLRTTISGNGWAPPGLASLDWDVVHTLKCSAPRAIWSSTLTIVLPTARRADVGAEPFGFGHMPGGQHISTPVAVVGDDATLTEVTGASSYTVCYYPQFSAYLEPLTARYDGAGGVVGWDLVAEEA